MFVQNFYLPFQNVYVGYVVGNMESTTHIGLCFYRIKYMGARVGLVVEVEVAVGAREIILTKQRRLMAF